MDDNPSCPVCARKQWQILGSQRYERELLSEATPYERARYGVLFDIWFNGADAVNLRTVACQHCGFVMYAPRPSVENIQVKYEYLNRHPEAKGEYCSDLPSDKRRSRELYRFVTPYLGVQSGRVLDFGGGKGRLLHEFVTQGHRCGVVDYVAEVIPGVEYLGHELDVLPFESRFDLVLCSHVIEHLADPLEAVSRLAARLSGEGHLYIEVPSEIWKCPPPKMDPVTHVNFFTTDSLRTLMETAGLVVLCCRYETFTRPNGKVGLGIKAIGQQRAESDSGEVTYRGADALTHLLFPSLLDRARRVFRHPRLLRNVLPS